MKTLNILWAIILLSLSSFLIATAQTKFASDSIPFDSIKTIFQELQSYDKMVIKTDLDSFMLNKKLGQKQTATVMFSGEEKSHLKFSILIEARGKFRRRICELPPIKLNFRKPDLDTLGLYRKYDKLKLVTHCLLEPESEQLLLKEFWTYKMYNELSDNSFQVHRFEIVYIHSKDPKRKIRSYAFILENNRELAHRLGGQLVDLYGIKPSQLTPTSYHHALLFNYMIGNTDWKVSIQKNLKFVRHKRHTLLTLVPYDFDYAKLVDAPYMAPDPDAIKADEHNRHAKGKFVNEQSLSDIIEQFKDLRKTGFRCYKDCPILKSKEKGKMTYFMNTFYQMLRNEKRIAATFLANEDK